MKSNKILIIGLTGNSGSGKSTVASYLKDHYRIYTIDGDSLGHKLYAPSSPAFNELVEAFGGSVLDEETGSVSRSKLRHIVFNDSKALAQLNRIAHYHIRQMMLGEIEEAKESGLYDAVIFDAVKLLESDIKEDVDTVWSVVSAEEERVKRLLVRDQLKEEDIQKRLAAQWKNDEYIEASHQVIYNHGTLLELYQQCDSLATLYNIGKKHNGGNP